MHYQISYGISQTPLTGQHSFINVTIPDSKVHGANMGPAWVLSAPDGPHIGPMNLAISDVLCFSSFVKSDGEMAWLPLPMHGMEFLFQRIASIWNWTELMGAERDNTKQ